MTPPADLAALRKLLEAVDLSEIDCLATINQPCIHDLVPAALEALERVAIQTQVYSIEREELMRQRDAAWEKADECVDRLARLEEALNILVRACEAGAYVGRTSPAVTQARVALGGRDD